MRFEIVATLACEKKNCPTTYRTERGTYLVQGTPVTDPAVLAELDVPVNESLLEVPAELLDRHAKESQA